MSIATNAHRVEIYGGEYIVIVQDHPQGRQFGIVTMTADRGVIDMVEDEGWEFHVTDAPADYDYGATIELDPEYATGRNGRTYRLIAIRPIDKTFQFPRYASGLYTVTDRRTFHREPLYGVVISTYYEAYDEEVR